MRPDVIHSRAHSKMYAGQIGGIANGRHTSLANIDKREKSRAERDAAAKEIAPCGLSYKALTLIGTRQDRATSGAEGRARSDYLNKRLREGAA